MTHRLLVSELTFLGLETSYDLWAKTTLKLFNAGHHIHRL